MNALVRLGERSARLAQAVVPDPFVISILLAALALLVALGAGMGPREAATSFTGGMLEPGLLAFGFQMALILITGHALAEAPAMRRLLQRLADRPTTTAGAAAMVAAVTMVLGLLNWGLGLVGGAFLAREVGRSFVRRGRPLNYALVGAAGYMGMLVWHGGLSGSAPLTVASGGNAQAAIPITATLLSPLNLFVTSALFVLVTLLFAALGSGTHESGTAPPPAEAPPSELPRAGFAGRLEHTLLVTALLVLPIGAALGLALLRRGAGAVNLDWVILLFFVVGLVFHRTPAGYCRAFNAGAGGAGGILLQFPIYFGVMAVMRDSGAMRELARGFSGLTHALEALVPPSITASIGTFFSAAIVNLLVPSGGGQWKLQAPLIFETAANLELSPAPLVMAFSYGDQLTNMLQPFWALPLLAITRLSARHLMGYTLLAMLAAIPVIVLGLVIF